MDLDDLRVFAAAARGLSLTAAARRTRLSIATVARRIDRLEAALGLRLFDRMPSGIALTAHGQALHERALAVDAAVDEVARAALALREGAWLRPVRVSAVEAVVAEILAPALPRLLAAAPGIRVDLCAQSEIVSLSARQADVAVRLARPEGDSLVVRRLSSIRFGLYASRGYLGARDPVTLDLAAERMLAYDGSVGPIPEVLWFERAGLGARVVARASSTRALVTATAAGAGIGLLPRLLARREGELIEVPAPLPLPERPAWLVHHRDLHRTVPVRAVRDWIAAVFQGRAAPDGAAPAP